MTGYSRTALRQIGEAVADALLDFKSHEDIEIILEAASLPVEERMRVVDSLLRSLNQADPENDAQWAIVAKRRIEELRSGLVTPVSRCEVFEKFENALTHELHLLPTCTEIQSAGDTD